MHFSILAVILVVFAALSVSVDAHFPVYSLYKERKPVDLFQALATARQAKRRAGGFEENYDLPINSNSFYQGN